MSFTANCCNSYCCVWKYPSTLVWIESEGRSSAWLLCSSSHRWLVKSWLSYGRCCDACCISWLAHLHYDKNTHDLCLHMFSFSANQIIDHPILYLILCFSCISHLFEEQTVFCGAACSPFYSPARFVYHLKKFESMVHITARGCQGSSSDGNIPASLQSLSKYPLQSKCFKMDVSPKH